MAVFQLKSTIRITCARHCAPNLEEELLQLGYSPENIAESGIKLNDSFEASNPDQLYKELNSLPWDEYVPAKGYISITSHVENEHIRDTRFANLRVKDAIVDQINNKKGSRPDSGPDTSR